MLDLYPYRAAGGLWFCRIAGQTLGGTLTQRAAWAVFRRAQRDAYAEASR
jgi:hypothetical protein